MRHLVCIYLLLMACQGSHSTHEMVEFTEEQPISYEFITENLEEGNLNTDLVIWGIQNLNRLGYYDEAKDLYYSWTWPKRYAKEVAELGLIITYNDGNLDLAADHGFFLLEGYEPEDPRVYLIMADLILEKNLNLTQARKLFEQYIEVSDNTMSTKGIEARLLIHEGDTARGMEKLFEFIEVGGLSDPVMELVHSLSQSDQHKKSLLQHLTNQEDWKDTEIFRLKGNLMLSLGDTANARFSFLEKFRRDSIPDKALFQQIARSYEAVAMHDSVIHFGSMVLEIDSLERVTVFSVSRAYESKGNLSDALALLENLYRYQPEDSIILDSMENLKRKIAYLWAQRQREAAPPEIKPLETIKDD